MRNEELEEISEQVRHLVATVDAKNAELQQVKLEKEKIRQKQKRKQKLLLVQVQDREREVEDLHRLLQNAIQVSQGNTMLRDSQNLGSTEVERVLEEARLTLE